MARALFEFAQDTDRLDARLEWERFISNPPSLIACDTETVNLVDQTMVGLAIAYSPDRAWYWTADDPELKVAIGILQDPEIRKVYHNASFDLRVLRPYHVTASNVDDTAILLRLLRRPVPLEEAGESVGMGLHIEQAKEFMVRLGIKTMDKAPVDQIAAKCAKDAIATYRLFIDSMSTDVMPYYLKFERPLLLILDNMSGRGIKIDQEVRARLEKFYATEALYYETVAGNMGFRISSNFETGYMMAKRGNFLPFTKGKRQLSVSEETLSGIDDPLADMVLLYRQAAGLLSKYLLPMQGLDRVYTTLSADAITGRLASSRMNLQNIPKLADREMVKRGVPTVRSMFLPDNGVWTVADASQLELRVLAYLSQDKVMLNTFASGGDIHNTTEQAIWGTSGINRTIAKNFNFAMVYLATPSTIARHSKKKDIGQVASWMRQWLGTYPEVAQWLADQQTFGLKYGYVETLFGRKMALPWEMGEKHMRSASVNYPVQGTAAEIFKLMMIYMGEDFRLRDNLTLQVHDEELIDGEYEMPTDIADITPVHTPLEVVHKERWG